MHSRLLACYDEERGRRPGAPHDASASWGPHSRRARARTWEPIGASADGNPGGPRGPRRMHDPGRLTGLLGQREPDRPARLRLTDRCAIDGLPRRSNVLHFQAHHIAAPQFAVDDQVKHGQIACSPLEFQLSPDRPNVFGRSGGFGPISLLLFQHGRLAAVAVELSSSCMVVLLRCRERRVWLKTLEITSASGLILSVSWLSVRMVGAAGDPSETLAVHCGNGFDAGFSPYQSTRLSRYNAGP
jgi:hypothetical protein